MRQAREKLNLSLRAVAKAIDMSHVALHQIEMGMDPMLRTAAKIACFFGQPIEALWPRLRL